MDGMHSVNSFPSHGPLGFAREQISRGIPLAPVVRTLAPISLGNSCLLPELVWLPLVTQVSLLVLSVTLSQHRALACSSL